MNGFFIGWSSRLPRGLGTLLLAVAAVLLVGFTALPLALGRGGEDPGPGGIDWAAGEQVLVGRLRLDPYPTLWLPEEGRTVLLAGGAQTGPTLGPGVADGALVEARGAMIRRGGLQMLTGGAPLRLVADQAPAGPTTEPLGTWRIAGEICDGKCAAGAMRPGTGRPHRPCANFCLIGEIPAVFLAAGALAGRNDLLLAGPDGGRPPAAMLDWVGLGVIAEGQVERRGDLLVFRADFSTLRSP